VQRLVDQRVPAAKRGSRWGVLAQLQPRAWLAAVALVVLSTVATVVVVSVLRPQVPTELPIEPVDAPVAEAAPADSAAPEPRRLEPIAVAIAPDEGSPMRDDVAIARLAPELAQHQVTLSQDGDAVSVRGTSGQVEVGVDARTEPVNIGDVRGYLLTTRYPGATAATWVGGSATGPWRVVPLSVNDCPAEARSQAFGIELQYEKSYRFLVPYGGADFVDVEVPRPEFAERAELMPYGVAFGRSRPDRVALPCTVGWSAQGLRLERLPPGDYQVVWMGGARTEAQDVVVQRAGAPKIGPLVPR